MGGAVPSHLVQILISVLVVKDQAELLGGGAILFSVFCGTAGLFGNGAQGFRFLHILSDTCWFFFVCFFFYGGRPIRVRSCHLPSPPGFTEI